MNSCETPTLQFNNVGDFYVNVQLLSLFSYNKE